METNKVYREHCLHTLQRMPDNFLDCVVTSPPYYGLRSYGTPPQVWGGDADCEHDWYEIRTKRDNAAGGVNGSDQSVKNVGAHFVDYNDRSTVSHRCSICKAWKGELGLEPTPAEYIEHMMMIFREVYRVLKPTGTVWINIADSYDKRKSLMNIPARFAIAMTDDVGFIQRNVLNWWKRSTMPSSALDRFTNDFEPIFFFTKTKRYWFKTQYERAKSAWQARSEIVLHENSNRSVPINRAGDSEDGTRIMRTSWETFELQYEFPAETPLAAMWDINTANGDDRGMDHFAAYPLALVERPVLAGCPDQICTKCGKARTHITKKQSVKAVREAGSEQPTGNGHQSSTGWRPPRIEGLGMSDCGCGAGWRPGIVYDPFCGTGTTAIVAHRLGRDFIGSELQPEYAEGINKRIDLETSKGRLFR